MTDDLPGLPPHSFEKEDDAPDALFYAAPRLVKHIDEARSQRSPHFIANSFRPAA